MFENGQNMDPQTREGIRNLMQSVAQNFFNRTGMGIQPAPPPPPPKTDYTPVIIAAVASIVAAVILTRK